MVGNICSWFVIDRVGRRNLTLWGVAVLTIILMLAGGLATVGSVPALKGCIAFMVVYGFFYNISIGSTAYTILTENATSRLRIKTIAIGIAVQNSWYTMWNLVLPYLFNPDKANLGAKVCFSGPVKSEGVLTVRRSHSSLVAYLCCLVSMCTSISRRPLGGLTKNWTRCT